jgi:hypothetical protein
MLHGGTRVARKVENREAPADQAARAGTCFTR